MKMTTNYDQFISLDHNRKINKDHVKRLVESIKTNNLMEANPIIVNHNFEVIDGQHRLEACRILRLPVPYVVIDQENGIGTVVRLNTIQKAWTLMDFIDSYISQGNQHYQVLKDFAATYHLPIHVAGTILQGKASTVTRAIKSGQFKIGNLKLATLTVVIAKQVQPYVENSASTDREFLMALYSLLKEKRIEPDRFIRKMSIFGEKLIKYSTITNYLHALEERYNYKAKNHVRIF